MAVRESFVEKKLLVLPHPPYSPDLALYDFFLFPNIKTHLKGHHFGKVSNIYTATTKIEYPHS